MVSVVGPGMGSARSNRSHFCDLQKYGALNSSLRQMICAPRAAASRTRSTVAATVAAASSLAESWIIAAVKGGVFATPGKVMTPREALTSRGKAGHPYDHVIHVRS